MNLKVPNTPLHCKVNSLNARICLHILRDAEIIHYSIKASVGSNASPAPTAPMSRDHYLRFLGTV